MHRGPGEAYRAPGAVYMDSATHRGPGAVYRAPQQYTERLEQCIEPQSNTQRSWSNVQSPRATHRAQEVRAPVGSSMWVNPCLAPMADSSKIGQAVASEIAVLSWACTEEPPLLCVGLGRSPQPQELCTAAGAVAAASSLPR